MKKLYLIIIALIIFIPIKINAIEINNINLVGKKQVTVGELFTESILISFDDLTQSYDQEQGIFYIKYEIIFDPEIFSITSYESPDWDTYIYKEEDKYYVLSIVNTENKLKQNCPNSFLYCGEYQNTIEFFPNKTTLTDTNITITNVELGILGVYESTQLPSIAEIIIKPIDYEKKYDLMINQAEESIEISPKEDIVMTISDQEIEDKINNALSQKPVKSEITSNFLKNIVITDHSIKFNKYQNNYKIKIPKSLKKVDIEVILEDANATYEIIGNENLTNNSQISIIVTSTDNEINTYIIDVTQETSSSNKEIIAATNSSFKFSKIYPKYKKYLIPTIIIIGIILLTIIISKIISKIKDKKIEDMTNKF